MLFHTTFTPKPGYGHEDQKKALELWSRWTPPEGHEIKSFYMSSDGRGFIVTEITSAEAGFEAAAPWASVYLNYDTVPVVPIDEAIPILQKAIAFRESE